MAMINADFEQVYQNNYPKVFAFIYNLTTDWSLTEDVTQEAMLKAYKQLHTFRRTSLMSECIQSKISLLSDNYRAPLFLDSQEYACGFVIAVFVLYWFFN